MPEFPAPEVVYRSGRRLRGLDGRVRWSRACCSHFGGRPRRFPRPRANLSRFTIASTMSSCSVRSSVRILFTSTVWLPSLGGTTRTAPRTLRIRRLHGCNPCGDQATVGVPSPSVAATYCTAVNPVNATPFAEGFPRFLRMRVNLPQIPHPRPRSAARSGRAPKRTIGARWRRNGRRSRERHRALRYGTASEPTPTETRETDARGCRAATTSPPTRPGRKPNR